MKGKPALLHILVAEKRTGMFKPCRLIFRPENLLVDITGTEKEYDGIEEQSEKFAKALYTEDVKKGELKLVPDKKNEGFKTAGQVQYVSKVGLFDGSKETICIYNSLNSFVRLNLI